MYLWLPLHPSQWDKKQHGDCDGSNNSDIIDWIHHLGVILLLHHKQTSYHNRHKHNIMSCNKMTVFMTYNEKISDCLRESHRVERASKSVGEWKHHADGTSQLRTQCAGDHEVRTTCRVEERHMESHYCYVNAKVFWVVSSGLLCVC